MCIHIPKNQMNPIFELNTHTRARTRVAIFYVDVCVCTCLCSGGAWCLCVFIANPPIRLSSSNIAVFDLRPRHLCHRVSSHPNHVIIVCVSLYCSPLFCGYLCVLCGVHAGRSASSSILPHMDLQPEKSS